MLKVGTTTQPVNNDDQRKCFRRNHGKNYRASVCAVGNYVNDVTVSKADWRLTTRLLLSRQNGPDHVFSIQHAVNIFVKVDHVTKRR